MGLLLFVFIRPGQGPICLIIQDLLCEDTVVEGGRQADLVQLAELTHEQAECGGVLSDVLQAGVRAVLDKVLDAIEGAHKVAVGGDGECAEMGRDQVLDVIYSFR